ncbi:MAG TPA: hypothetical protein VGI36_04775 [Candidatus Binataceae bacterium]
MKNPSPGPCLGGFGRPGDGTVDIGAALIDEDSSRASGTGWNHRLAIW